MGGDVPDVHIERTPLQLVLLLASTLLCTCYCLGSCDAFHPFSIYIPAHS